MIDIINKIKNLFKERNKRRELRKSTLIRVTGEYEALINEFRLIQEKKSQLSRNERDFVELRIIHLISKGHIQVNK